MNSFKFKTNPDFHRFHIKLKVNFTNFYDLIDSILAIPLNQQFSARAANFLSQANTGCEQKLSEMPRKDGIEIGYTET